MKPELAKRVESVSPDGTVSVSLTFTADFQNHATSVERQLHQLQHDALLLAAEELTQLRSEDSTSPSEVLLTVGSTDYTITSEDGYIEVECTTKDNPVHSVIADAFGDFSYTCY